MLHYLYILYSDKYKKTYTGITRDIERRLNEHNSGKSKFTSKFLPWKLIYIEECSSREEARIKEKYGAESLKFLILRLDKDLIELLIDYIKKNGQAVTTGPLAKPLPDPDDAPFLEVAIEGKSEILVTGNKIHYPMKYRKGIKVLSPTEFIKFYQKIKDSAEHHV